MSKRFRYFKTYTDDEVIYYKYDVSTGRYFSSIWGWVWDFIENRWTWSAYSAFYHFKNRVFYSEITYGEFKKEIALKELIT